MRPLFWDVDTLYDFMRKDGALYVQGAERIEPQLAQLRRYADMHDSQIIHMNDWHTMDSEEFKKYPVHCLVQTTGALQVPVTRPGKEQYRIHHAWKSFDHQKVRANRHIVIYKDSTDSFDPVGAAHTERVLRLIGPDVNIVSGVAAEICVDALVMGLLSRQQPTYVAVDAIKELPGTNLEEYFSKWRSNGAELRTVAQLEPLVQQWALDKEMFYSGGAR